MKITRILVLGAGSAGLMAAITLKRKLPALEVKVVRSPDIGVIGVGESTTPALGRHFFEYLKLKPQQFYEEAEPTWKLGIRFAWGAGADFYYTFVFECQQRMPELSRNNGFYLTPASEWAGPVSALLAHGKAFPRKADGSPHFHRQHAFHIENKKLVAWLENVARAVGIGIIDATVAAERGDAGITALVTAEGQRLTADLYVDASGFRSELLDRTLNEPFLSYTDSLFCDRAAIGGWPRTDEPIQPYTVAETMDSGWCWKIEHERYINRGYVFSSAFASDDQAIEELMRKNPKISAPPRIVRYRSGRYARNWVGNVVAVGNSAGFVEPLEATALQIICVEASTLADSLVDSLCEPPPTLIELYNRFNAQAWDDIRDFLGIHFRFNTRVDSPFWRACRNEVRLHGAEFLVDFYRENGPSVVAGAQLLHASNSFGIDGYLTLLRGQGVPHAKAYAPPPTEERIWRDKYNAWGAEGKKGLDVAACLAAIRKNGAVW